MNENQPERIYLSLGTNLGNRELNLEAVKGDLPPQVKILDCSPIYQTEPWGYLDQPDFLNQVLAVETFLSPSELLEYIKGIEKKIGREPGFRFGPCRCRYAYLPCQQWVAGSQHCHSDHHRQDGGLCLFADGAPPAPVGALHRLRPSPWKTGGDLDLG